MRPRDPRPIRLRGIGRGDGGSVVLSIDVDGVHGEAGPPLKLVLTADEARLTADLLHETAARRRHRDRLPIDCPHDKDAVAETLEAGVVALEGWGRAVGRHVRGFLGLRSASGAADPRAPP